MLVRAISEVDNSSKSVSCICFRGTNTLTLDKTRLGKQYTESEPLRIAVCSQIIAMLVNLEFHLGSPAGPFRSR